MVKGVFLALGIMLILALIPIVDVVGIPFGPFIGAYVGISLAGPRPGASMRELGFRAAIFGGLLGLLMLPILVAVAVSLTVTLGLSPRFIWLIWMAVVVFTIYTATMATLGALYSQLRKAGKDDNSPSNNECVEVKE